MLDQKLCSDSSKGFLPVYLSERSLYISSARVFCVFFLKIFILFLMWYFPLTPSLCKEHVEAWKDCIYCIYLFSTSVRVCSLPIAFPFQTVKSYQLVDSSYGFYLSAL